MVQLDILSNTFVRSIETNFISSIVYVGLQFVAQT